MTNWHPTEPYGWAGEFSIPNKTDYDTHTQLYNDITVWITENISRPLDNAQWTKIGDCIYFRFRKKQDFTLFLLRWGHE